jgi:NAD(P)H-dependent flavin oxidoreductase YrpB (nitropropane dioxygenase family)
MAELKFPKTRITELFGIKYPLLQGGMAAGFVSTAELVAAVGNAGGIGFISCIQWETNVSKLEDEVKKAKDLTDKPFGMNFTIFPEYSNEFYHKVMDIIVRQGVKAIESSARKPDPWMKHFKEAGCKVIHKVARIKDGITAARLGADATRQ